MRGVECTEEFLEEGVGVGVREVTKRPSQDDLNFWRQSDAHEMSRHQIQNSFEYL